MGNPIQGCLYVQMWLFELQFRIKKIIFNLISDF